MKDVENLFRRLGTKTEYQDFGSKVLDDVRQKWPLLDNVSAAEKLRMPTPLTTAVKKAIESISPALPTQEIDKIPAVKPENRLPVRAFMSKKAPAQESVRDIFKAIGKSNRLTPVKDMDPLAKPKNLFDGAQLNNSKKT